MHIAVIIAARPSDISVLRWTLEGFATQQFRGHTLEIRVGIDGGAGTPPFFEAPSGIPVHFQNFPRAGAAAIRNQLVAATSADLLIFGNADARPDPDMVQQHADTIGPLPDGSMVLGAAPWESPRLPTGSPSLMR